MLTFVIFPHRQLALLCAGNNINPTMLQKLITAGLLLAHSFTFAQVSLPSTVGQRTFRFTDQTRNRPLVTEVWYPTSDTLKKTDQAFSPFIRQFTVRDGRLPAGKLPLIMLSHGTGGGRLTLEWLAQGLAQNGFIVAAVDHWGNTYDNKIPIEFLKPWERPLDISFVLTALLSQPEFDQVIDSKRLGATGFSFGGYTVIALAGGVLDYNTLLAYYKKNGRHKLEVPELPGVSKHLDDPVLAESIKRIPVLKDGRFIAFFAVSPALGEGFTSKKQVAQLQAPLYIVGSQSDSISPVKTNARHYHQLINGSEYYEFPGKTGHYVMLNAAIDDVKRSDPTYFVDAPTVDRQAVHEQMIRLATRFFKDKLR